ncbi:hypothetical protein QFC22_001677 [Naganishia vaughanmartiniae]|uniref:Uncharacterized protein n=1 Tax=Naganishia vaughanmartiniae TaxID=1424756 RepID=A0ACC2XEB1_9TREE|nr:hypothetical protein QFC22_001677 [Naganishia vaughanmartiniae]
MDRLTTPELNRVVRRVVRKADRKGDIDRGAFTLKVAKQEIGESRRMLKRFRSYGTLGKGFPIDSVKDLVYEAIENVDTLKNSPIKPSREDDPKAEQHAFINAFLSDEAKSQERKKKEQGSHHGQVAGGKKTKGKARVDSDDRGDVRPSGGKVKKDRKSKIGESEEETEPAPVDSEDSLDEHPPQVARKRPRSDVESSGSEEDGSAHASAGKNGQANGKKKRADAGGKVKVKPSAKASTSTPAAPSAANQQVAHLKSLLAELGMTGRPTKAKAKAIKERRELAAELGDVLEFEAKRGLGITSSRRNNTNTQASPKTAASNEKKKQRRAEAVAVMPREEEDFESSGSEEPPVPRKKLVSPQKKVATNRNIFVHPGDSDDEDDVENLKWGDEKKGGKSQAAKGNKRRGKVRYLDLLTRRSGVGSLYFAS